MRPASADTEVQVMDLSDVAWLDPVHLVGIAAGAQLAASRGGRLRLTGLAGDRADYAARMHVAGIIERFGGEHELPSVIERDLRDSLLEVRMLASPRDVRELAALVFNRVSGHAPAVARALHLALAEVGSNVCDHSRSIGFMAAQTIAGHGVLRFAVADSGVGLRATLRARGATDDQSALNLALSGTSRRAAPGHGTGLPSTVAIVSSLGGEVLLASGKSASTATLRGRRHRGLGFHFNGTIFEGSVPAAASSRTRRSAGALVPTVRSPKQASGQRNPAADGTARPPVPGCAEVKQ